MTHQKVNVLIVDDSAMIRRVLTLGLNEDPEIEVLGAASSAEMARRHIERAKPDVITLDLEMPEMDGLSFLKSYIHKNPIPTVVISSFTQEGARASIDALQAGAVDVIAKPTLSGSGMSNASLIGIRERVKVAAKAHVVSKPIVQENSSAVTQAKLDDGRPSDWIIGIGASTGGVQALAEVLPKLPKTSPGIVVVQHMPEGFTLPFSRRLNSVCAITVSEAKDGDIVKNGHAYIAPGGDKHMIVTKRAGQFVLRLVDGDPVCFSRPSVDVLFNSLAKEASNKCAAAILTGMGKDGANGLLNIRQSGGATFAQDQDSCVVFGMPKAAQKIGATDNLIHLDFVADNLLRSTSSDRRNTGSTNATSTSFRR